MIMKLSFKHIAIALAGLCAFTACENDPFLYQDEARVRLVGDKIWAVGTDSVEFSFVSQPASAQSFGIDVDAVIMGLPAEADRTVALAVDAAGTTADASLYSFPATVTIPAGQDRGTFTVTLNKGAVLETKAVRLRIVTTPNDDFAVGVNEENHLTFVWSNMLKRPLFWDTIEEHFGAYSNAKYRFMLDCMMEYGNGSTDLDPANLNWSDLHNYKIVFVRELKAYNAAHPGAPLTDENGVLVTFPE